MAPDLKPGDQIYCLIKENRIVSSYSEADSKRVFEILAVDEHGFFIYTPDYLNIKDTQYVNINLVKLLNINTKFLNCLYTYISFDKVYKIHSLCDGCICARCNEFYTFATANQDDGGFLCWVCRTYHNY